MRDKIRLEVLLPATRRRYDVRMPYDITVGQGARLVSRMLATREATRYEASEKADLLLLEGDHAGELLNPRETFRGLVLAGTVVEGTAVMLA